MEPFEPMPTVKNPYARAIRITWTLAGMAALSFLVGLPLRKTGGVLPVLLLAGGAMLLIGCAITLPVCYLYGRLAVLQIQAVLDGGHWAHWVYGRDEWGKFAESEWKGAQKSAVRTGLKAAGGMLLIGISLHFFADDVPLANGALLGAAMGVAFGAIVTGAMHLFARATHKSRLANLGEVYIASGGVYQDGTYMSWEIAGMKLQSVTMEPGDPAVLQFKITDSRGGSTNYHVAIPSDKVTEARHVVRQFEERNGSLKR